MTVRKRKINPQYLKYITAQDVRSEEIAALDLVKSITAFTEEYLGGIMELEVKGRSAGTVHLNLPVTSYLLRLLCECGDFDEVVEATLSVDDDLILTVSYDRAPPTEDVAYIVRVARLAGFTVDRRDSTLVFKAKIRLTSIMQIYATPSEEFLEILIRTFKM